MSLLKRERPLHWQTRDIILNVHKFMTKEAEDAKTCVFNKYKFLKVIDRTAQATKVSKRTMSRVLSEKEEARMTAAGSLPSFKTPKKGKYRKTYRLELDEFAYQAIRRKVYDSQLLHKQTVTVNTLLTKIKEEIAYTGSRETLRKILKILGFKYKKIESSRSKFLAEKNEIRLLRIKYLRQIKKYRNEGRDIVYGDEKYVHFTHKKDRAIARLIILHAGSANGFVPNSLLTYKSPNNKGDPHTKTNKENYDKWLQFKVIPNLQPNSVFVIDEASYQNTLEERAPSSNSKKKTMQDWLTSNEIQFERKMIKPELYEIIKRHKDQYVKYSVDTIMEAHGHKVLRLPPHHPDFNPIKTIWPLVKDHLKKSCYVAMNLSDVQRLVTEKFESIGQEEWRKFVDQAIFSEDEFLTIEEAMDDVLDEVVTNTDDESSSASASTSGESEYSGSDAYSDTETKDVVRPIILGL